MLKHYIGDRAFYKRVLAIAIPIIIQNGITNFVNLLDNIMVGQVGTIPMSGVSIVNSVIFVFNICIFGASSGAGIFTAQFHGSCDQEGIRHTFRYKTMICLLITVLGLGVFLVGGPTIVGLYLTGEGDAATAAGAMEYGLRYLRVMLWGFLPFAVSNVYSSTLRETGETMVPMAAGICAVVVNLVLNYTLIFGHFGAPAMGVEGAALATVISRYVEMAIVIAWTHLHADRHGYIRGAYRSFYIPGRLFKSITLKGTPLLINEFFWASGMAILNQSYSTCGLNVVPAMNISSTMSNLGSVVFLALGNTVGIIMGQQLGAGHKVDFIRDQNRKLMAFATVVGGSFGLVLIGVSGLFPQVYNTDQEVRLLATRLICICGIMMPFNSYCNAAYFTLRSGGQTIITFLFDSFYMWAVCVPLAFCLSRFTDMSILPLYCLCQSTELLKCLLGGFVLKQGKWIQNLTV